MGKQTPKAAEGKRKRTKKTKPSKPQKDDATRQAAADKRRERRQSKSQGSKRNMRRGKRTEAGGMKQKHTHMAAQALSRANPNASWYHKNCIDFSRKSEAKQAAIVNAILGDFPPPMRAALNCIAPSSFFADTPLQGPKGLFINSALTLQLLSSNQARKNVKSPALTKGTGADAPSAEGVSRAKRIIEARKPTLPLFDHLRSRHAKERSDAAGELVGYLKKAIKNVDKEALAAAGDSEKGIDALIGEVPSYVLKRLVKGLSGGGEGSRLGFSLCLFKILGEEELSCIPVEYFVTVMERELVFTGVTEGMMAGSEQKQIAWGLMFFVVMVLSSGRSVSRISLMVLAEKLFSVYNNFRQAREAIAVSLIAILFPEGKSGNENIHKAFVPKIFENIFEVGATVKPETWTPEALYLFFNITSNVSRLHSFKDKVTALQENVKIFDRTLQDSLLSNLLKYKTKRDKKTTTTSLDVYPRVHSVWGSWVHHIHATQGGNNFDKVLEHFWRNFSKIVYDVDTDIKDDAEAKRGFACKKKVVSFVLQNFVTILAKAPDTQPLERLKLLATFSIHTPSITGKLADVASASDKAYSLLEVKSLIGKFNSVFSDDVKKIFESGEETNFEPFKQPIDSEEGSEDDEKMAVDKDDEADAASDVELGSDDEESEVDTGAERLSGHSRFKYNMVNFLVTELSKVVKSDATIEQDFEAFEQASLFLLKHGMFSTPSGTVDGDGLFCVESVPLIQRKRLQDAFMSSLRHVSVAECQKKTTAVVPSKAAGLFAKVMQLFSKLRSNPAAEALFPESASMDEKVPERVLEASMSKFLVAYPKQSKAHKTFTRHLPHFASLYALLYFNLILDWEGFEGVDEVTETYRDAVADFGNVLMCKDVSTSRLMESLMVVNLKAHTDATAYVASLINKVTCDIIVFCLAKHIDVESLQHVIQPLLSSEAFTMVDNDDDQKSESSDEESAESEGEDEEEDTRTISRQQHNEQITNEEIMQKQLSQVRIKALNYLTLLMKQRQSGCENLVGVWAHVANVASDVAENNLPGSALSKKRKKKDDGSSGAWNVSDKQWLARTAPLCSSTFGLLETLSSASTEMPKADQIADITAAYTNLLSFETKSAGRFRTREGGRLKYLATTGAFFFGNFLYKFAKANNDAALLTSLTEGVAQLFKSGANMSAYLVPEMAKCFRQNPLFGAEVFIPTLRAAIPATSEEKAKFRPFHLQMWFRTALALAKQWDCLDAVKDADSKIHKTMMNDLIAIAMTLQEDELADKTATQPWRPMHIDPAVTLHSSLARYIKKTDTPAASKAFEVKSAERLHAMVKKAHFLTAGEKSALRRARDFIDMHKDFASDLKEVISKNPKHKKRKRAEEDTGDDLKVVEQPKRQRGKKVVPGIFGAAGLMSAEEAEKRAAEKKVLTNRGPVAEPEKPAEEPKEKKEKKPKKEKKNKKDKNAAKKAETEKKVEEPKEKKEKKEKMED